MPDRQAFLNQDLVLQVSPSVDPARFDISRYEPFLDALCGAREYQKEAIRVTLRYLLGGRYTNLRALADLQERYGRRTAVDVSDAWSEEDLHDLMQASLAHAERTIWGGENG
jgi:Arc/MetJ-type ribon-helix-helix transcriptional regulator